MYVKSLDKLTKNDAHIAGGKGASLGEMFRAGFKVPPGFVVLASAFRDFLKETDLFQEVDALLDSVDRKTMHTIDNASGKIRTLILNAEIPCTIKEEIQKAFRELGSNAVAVRSSATAEDSAEASWAGQLESFLNTTEENLLKNVKKCWASLFTPRAIFYRFESGFHFEKGSHGKKVSVAVVVQKMVHAEVAGVAFSVHPVTEDKNHLIIEAVRGLGDTLVSGIVTPDSYIVEKEPRRILDVNVAGMRKGGTPVLSEKKVLELAGLVLKIEKHYGTPQDIEWAYAEGIFYIVQSRPITTLK